MGFTPFAWAIAIANLVGSLSSSLGSGFIVITYLILPIKRHFRHSLILNLAIADFMTSMNNSVGGLWRLIHRRELPDSPGCTANGFIEQISVQGTDTSIFAIAVVTVWALTRETVMRERLTRTTTFMICASCWVLPFANAITILVMGRYGPVSGNWCWIKVKPVYFRYVMMHGWRFAFIFSEVAMYLYLHIYLKRRFDEIDKSLMLDSDNSGNSKDRAIYIHPLASPINYPTTLSQIHLNEVDDTAIENISNAELGQVYVTRDIDQYSKAATKSAQQWMIKGDTKADLITKTLAPTTEVPKSATPDFPRTKTSRLMRLRFHFAHPFAHRSAEDDDLYDHEEDRRRVKNTYASRSRRVRRVLLLNAYPAMYILLWIPGIINRLVEATGHRSNVTALLQASTQFIGLANAITYGWNERVGSQLRSRISEWRSGVNE